MAQRVRLLSLLRILRNACAAGEAAAAVLLAADVPCRVLRAACQLASTPTSGCTDTQQLLAAALQLLANACAASPAAAVVVWRAWFPDALAQLLADTHGGGGESSSAGCSRSFGHPCCCPFVLLLSVSLNLPSK